MCELLTTGETAKRLGVSAKLLEQHRADMRGLPYVRLGRSIRYQTEDVNIARAYGALDFVEAKRRRLKVAGIRRRRKRIHRNGSKAKGGKGNNGSAKNRD